MVGSGTAEVVWCNEFGAHGLVRADYVWLLWLEGAENRFGDCGANAVFYFSILFVLVVTTLNMIRSAENEFTRMLGQQAEPNKDIDTIYTHLRCGSRYRVTINNI